MESLKNISLLALITVSFLQISHAATTFLKLGNPSFKQESIKHTNSDDYIRPIDRFSKRDINSDINETENRSYDERDLINELEETGTNVVTPDNQLHDEIAPIKTVDQIADISSRQNDETNVKANKENGNIPFLQNSGSEGNKDPGNIPFLQGSGPEGNKDSGGIPFLQGGGIPQNPLDGNNIPFIPGGGNFAQMIPGVGSSENMPKLVWGGFFFVETPLSGPSLANMASLMQSGQQMIPGGLPTQMLPIPGAG